MSDRKVESSKLSVEGQKTDVPVMQHSVSQPSTLNPQPQLSPGQRAWQRFRRNRAAVISAWYLVFLLLAIIAWPIILKISGGTFAQGHNPNQLSDAPFAPPGAQYWFGTDVHGRDVFSRVLFGAQISLLVGIVGAGVSLVIGVLWGAVAGYVGGRVDSALMRIVDVLYSLPTVIFVIVLIKIGRAHV